MPQYGDLVNVDWPSEHEYKHHTSNWEPYQRRDFDNIVRLFERLRKAAPRLTRSDLYRILVAAAPEIVKLAFHYLDARKYLPDRAIAWYPYIEFFLDVISLVLFALIILTKFLEVLRGFLVSPALIARGPVRVRDLAIILQGRVFVGFGPFDFGRSTIPIGRINNVRVVWVGNGQVQFGCGAKGISVEHHGGYLYLVHWNKVEAIYDSGETNSKTPDGAFDYERFQAQVDPDPDPPHISSVHVVQMAKRSDRGGYPLNHVKLDPKFVYAMNLARAAKKLGWAKESIRIRLHKTHKDDPPDEIIIPFRFFGEQEGELKWQDFMELCITYKFYPEQADGAGKSAGQIETGRPAHH